MSASDFWANQEKAQSVVVELKGIKSLLKPLTEAIQAAEDLATMIEMADGDEGFAAEVPGELQRLEKRVEELEVKALLERADGREQRDHEDQCSGRWH